MWILTSSHAQEVLQYPISRHQPRPDAAPHRRAVASQALPRPTNPTRRPGCTRGIAGQTPRVEHQQGHPLCRAPSAGASQRRSISRRWAQRSCPPSCRQTGGLAHRSRSVPCWVSRCQRSSGSPQDLHNLQISQDRQLALARRPAKRGTRSLRSLPSSNGTASVPYGAAASGQSRRRGV